MSESPTSHAAPAGGDEAWRRAGADERRERIVATAIELLGARGLEAVTMRNVACCLGLGTMTLYTYVAGQRGLHRAMVREGFRRLEAACDAASTLGTEAGWRGGARAYLRFALENPNLYKLMFDTPMAEADADLLEGGFQSLLQKVRLRMEAEGAVRDPDREARRRAGRYWIGLHGLAMLAISGRVGVLAGSVDEVLEDLLAHVAPG